MLLDEGAVRPVSTFLQTTVAWTNNGTRWIDNRSRE